MTRFYKPHSHDSDYHDLAQLAMKRALRDANLSYEQHIQQVYCGYIYGDSTCGQRACYGLGKSGIPIFNVNNNSCSGATAIYMARQAIASGAAECVMAVGFEKMHAGPHRFIFQDRSLPTQKLDQRDASLASQGSAGVPLFVRMYANAGVELMQQHGYKMEHFVRVAAKNRAHGVNNPYALYGKTHTRFQVARSRMIQYPLTLLQCAAPADGAAAVILCSEGFAHRHRLQAQAVQIKGISLVSDSAKTFTGSHCDLVGREMVARAAQKAYAESGLGPADVNVVELHDSFTTTEVLAYEALGLCPEGQAPDYICKGVFRQGGAGPVVNPSGGILARGHPIGATGVAQCIEICWQLRGMAEKRQVKDAKIGLQQTIGLGGACVVGLYRKYLPDESGKPRVDQTADVDKLEALEQAELEERAKL